MKVNATRLCVCCPRGHPVLCLARELLLQIPTWGPTSMRIYLKLMSTSASHPVEQPKAQSICLLRSE